ncbi:MAG: hypothetical protein ACTSRU_12715 [Candidatus Hodarchaeales archaeon]
MTDEWKQLRDKYKIQNIMPSLEDLDTIFAIGDKNRERASLWDKWGESMEHALTVIQSDETKNLKAIKDVFNYAFGDEALKDPEFIAGKYPMESSWRVSNKIHELLGVEG